MKSTCASGKLSSEILLEEHKAVIREIIGLIIEISQL